MLRRCPRSWLFALAVAAWAPEAAAQGEGRGAAWQDRSTWDWGQHRTGFAAEVQEMPVDPVWQHDHWDYPGAPVRFAVHGRPG